MRFMIANAARKTGALLERLVRTELGASDASAVVCYGAGYRGSLPALNAGCSSMNKLEQARALRTALQHLAINPLSLEETLAYMQANPGGVVPVLGRNVRHAKGKDIRLCLEAWQVEAMRGISDFFVPYLPSSGEWRTWVYRRRHLGSYCKVLQDASAMRRVGRNHENGFRFERTELADTPEGLKDVSRRAVAALGLDFGAVDALQTPSGEFVVLEVNSAPGVQDERRVVMGKLAHRIVRWVQEGYPRAAA